MRQRLYGWLRGLAGALRRLMAWPFRGVTGLCARWRGRTRRPPRPSVDPVWVRRINDTVMTGDDVRNAPWHLAIGMVAILLLVIGVTYATSAASSRPTRPFVFIAPVEQVGGAVFDRDVNLLYVEVEDTVRAYVAPDGQTLAYCETSGRIESSDGAVHDLDGRALSGGASLVQRRVQVVDELLYVDLTTDLPAPPSTDEGAVPECSPP